MQRFKLISAVHLFLFRDGKILLARRINTGYYDGSYSVPAGHLDGNETATQAMAREAQEELGITIKPKDLKVIHVMHRKAEEERIDFFFTTKKWQGELRIGEPDKCDDLGWFPFDNMPKNIVPYVLYAVNQQHYKIFYSEYGWEHTITYKE